MGESSWVGGNRIGDGEGLGSKVALGGVLFVMAPAGILMVMIVRVGWEFGADSACLTSSGGVVSSCHGVEAHGRTHVLLLVLPSFHKGGWAT